MLEHRTLEGAELGHPQEADEVATVGQLGMAHPADQPSMLRPVQTAMLTDGADRPAATPTAPSAEPEALSARVRKRFWIEGEGWIVRRVSACR